MANPFTFYLHPQTPKELQANANYATYAKHEALEALQTWEREHAHLQAPCDLISAVHTMQWVEKEAIREARKARIRKA